VRAEEKEFIHFSYAEPQFILFKDSESRAKNNQTWFEIVMPRRKICADRECGDK